VKNKEGEMANKIKETVDYFPFFVKDGKTLYVLKKKYGLAGIGFFTELMRILAQTPNHFYSYNDEFEMQRLIEYIGVPKEELESMLSDIANTGKIDSDLWNNYRVVLSKDFIASLTEAYRRRSGSIPNFENIKAAICRQYDGNMSETCSIKKRKEDKRKEKKRKENSEAAPPGVSENPPSSKPEKAKKAPLREREPANDMELVEKAYLLNWDSLYTQGKVKAINPVVNWNQTRKLLKTHFENLTAEIIIQAINNGMNDDWVLNTGYSLGTMLSASVLNRLINGNGSGPPRHRIAADNVSQEKVSSYFKEAK
jgi:hypothetical protein